MCFIELENQKVPRISIGTSPFMGAGQFGQLSLLWRATFLQNAELMAKLMMTSYQHGVKGAEVIPAGQIVEAALITRGHYPDFTIIASTFWETLANDFLIDKLINADSKIIFLHGSISDQRSIPLITPLLSKIRASGKIPGIATHYPQLTIPFIHQNKLDCSAILLPFNLRGEFMGDQKVVEELVNSLDYFFVAMKSLAAGKIPPKKAFPYLGKNNISAVTIGLVSEEEIIETITEAKKVFK
ncbi:MAG TPA: hypothetical protein VMV49_15465 [Candidatus Deferrimicrobium sp.]|nr:hypothetical protein [Candidatus Deferrimicrobium sp.]